MWECAWKLYIHSCTNNSIHICYSLHKCQLIVSPGAYNLRRVSRGGIHPFEPSAGDYFSIAGFSLPSRSPAHKMIGLHLNVAAPSLPSRHLPPWAPVGIMHTITPNFAHSWHRSEYRGKAYRTLPILARWQQLALYRTSPITGLKVY